MSLFWYYIFLILYRKLINTTTYVWNKIYHSHKIAERSQRKWVKQDNKIYGFFIMKTKIWILLLISVSSIITGEFIYLFIDKFSFFLLVIISTSLPLYLPSFANLFLASFKEPQFIHIFSTCSTNTELKFYLLYS